MEFLTDRMIEKYFNKDLDQFSENIKHRIYEAYKNDVGEGDITTVAIVKPMKVKAIIKAEEDGILAGIFEVRFLFERLGIKVNRLIKDGSRIKKGDVIMELEGDTRIIFQSERTVLNFLTRLSGIATTTNEMVNKSKMKITGTRKTILPFSDKRAIVLGGGYTHRIGLFSQYLIKDNHISAVQKESNCSRDEAVKECIKRVRENKHDNLSIEIEVENYEEAMIAAKEKPDIIMLDNIKIPEMKKIIEKLKDSDIIIEISGGVTPKNIEDFNELEADVISSGYITHSSKPLDMTLEVLG